MIGEFRLCVHALSMYIPCQALQLPPSRKRPSHRGTCTNDGVTPLLRRLINSAQVSWFERGPRRAASASRPPSDAKVRTHPMLCALLRFPDSQERSRYVADPPIDRGTVVGAPHDIPPSDVASGRV